MMMISSGLMITNNNNKGVKHMKTIETIEAAFAAFGKIVGSLPKPPNQIDKEFAMKAFKNLARLLHRLYEYQCNGTDREQLPNEDYEEYDAHCAVVMRQTEHLIKSAHDLTAVIAREAGLHVYHQTDPRGASIYYSNDPIDPSDYDRHDAF
jgi:hypothetical protein